MNKKILSLFCSGLMLFSNAPCCAMSNTSQPQLKDINDMTNPNDSSIGIDLSILKSNSSGAPQQGVQIAIEQITLELTKELQPNGTFAKGSHYNAGDELIIPVSLAYVDDQKTGNIKYKFRLIDDSSLISNINDKDQKNKAIEFLKKLKGLTFQLKPSNPNNTEEYLDCSILDYDTVNYKLNVALDSNDELNLQPMASDEIDSTTGIGPETQKLNLIISTDTRVTNASLTDLILILSDLESTFDYRLQIEGEKA